MKLTESRIKEIILEEIQAMSKDKQSPDAKEAPQEKTLTDVANMLRYIEKIDNVKKYSQLLSSVIEHNFGNDQQKKVILKNLRDKLVKSLQ